MITNVWRVACIALVVGGLTAVPSPADGADGANGQRSAAAVDATVPTLLIDPDVLTTFRIGRISGRACGASLAGDGGSAYYALNVSQDAIPSHPSGLYRRDLDTGEEQLLVLKRDAPSMNCGHVSPGGRFYVFQSRPTGLDDHSTADLALRMVDTESGVVTDIAADVPTQDVKFSDDDRYVFFTTRNASIVGGPRFHHELIYRYDTETGGIQLVTPTVAGGLPDARIESYSISADGQRIAFSSFATNIVPGNNDPFRPGSRVYLHDTVAGRTDQISPFGVDGSRGVTPLISADGHAVTYTESQDLTSRVVQVDVTSARRWTVAGVGGAAPDDPTRLLTANADGSVVVFESSASNLVEGIDFPPIPTQFPFNRPPPQLFAANTATGQIKLITKSATANAPASAPDFVFPLHSNVVIDDEASAVVFESKSLELVADIELPQPDQIYAYDMTTGAVHLVGRAEGNPDAADTQPNFAPVISATGGRVLFQRVDFFVRWPVPYVVAALPPAAPPVVSVGDVAVSEGVRQPSWRSALFPLVLSHPVDHDVTVTYRTVDGSATPPGDYEPVATGTVVVPAGAQGRPLEVFVKGDRFAEPDETFGVEIVSVSEGTVGRRRGTATILDYQEPAGRGISASDIVVGEPRVGTAMVVVTAQLPWATSEPVSLEWTTEAGSAHASEDFLGRSGTAVIPAGQRSARIQVWIRADQDTWEGPESFAVRLTSTSAFSIVDPIGVVTIALPG